MSKVLYKTEEVVENVLRQHKDSRNDDFVLVYRVYQAINENAVVRESFHHVMLNHNEYKLPAFTGITRARRKLQKMYPELAATKEIKEARINKTSEYINYSRSANKPKLGKTIDIKI